MGHRKMSAYGEREHNGRYVLDDYEFSRKKSRKRSRHLKDGKKAGKTGMIFASLESWWTKISTGTS